MDKGQVSGVGRHRPWHLRQLVHRRHSDNSIGGGKPSRRQQDGEVPRTGKDPPICANSNWNRRSVKRESSRVYLRSGKKNHWGNQRATGDHVPVPEDIRSMAERERDRVQEHIPVRALIFNPKACHFDSYNLIYNFQASGFVIRGEKKIKIIINNYNNNNNNNNNNSNK